MIDQEYGYGAEQDYEPLQKPEGPEQFSHARVKLRGWTDSMIKKLLGEPDVLEEPWDDPDGPPHRYYFADRVKQAEQTPEFGALKDKADARRQAIAKGKETRARQAAAEIEAFEIRLPELSDEELTRLAYANYDEWARSAGHRTIAQAGEYVGITAKVNFLRWNVEGADEQFQSILSKPDARALRRRLNERILQAIALKYPDFLNECERQNKRRLFASERHIEAREKRTAERKAEARRKKEEWAKVD